MPVFTRVNFDGHWPVGTSAVVVADTKADAARALEQELSRIGLAQPITPESMEYVPTEEPLVRILDDGDY